MKKIFKNRIVLAVIAIVLAAVVGFVGVPLVNNLLSTNMAVVRVNQDVNLGTRLTADMLETVEMGKLNMVEDVYTDISEAVGKYATADLLEGDLLVTRKTSNTLTDAKAKIRAMTTNQSMRSFSVSSATTDKLLPGDIITIYGLNASTKTYEIVPELQYVEVVCEYTASGEQILTESQVSSDGSRMVPSTLCLILNQEQMNTMINLGNNYYIVLTYRMPSNTTQYQAVADSYLAKQTAYFNRVATTTTVTDAKDDETDFGETVAG